MHAELKSLLAPVLCISGNSSWGCMSSPFTLTTKSRVRSSSQSYAGCKVCRWLDCKQCTLLSVPIYRCLYRYCTVWSRDHKISSGSIFKNNIPFDSSLLSQKNPIFWNPMKEISVFRLLRLCFFNFYRAHQFSVQFNK